MKDTKLKNYISAITDTVNRCYRECEGSCPLCENDKCQCEKAKNLERLKELAEYRRLDEEGLLLRLPCKVGDMVYLLDHSFLRKKDKPMRCEIDEFLIDNNGCYAVLNGTDNFYAVRRFKAISINQFGIAVFLTKEDAERALESMGGTK